MPIRALADLLRVRLSDRAIDVLQLGAYAFITILFVAGFWRIQQVNARLCRTTNANRTYIHDALIRSKKSLPTIAYYKTHPAELRKALADVNTTLAGLPPDPC